MLGRALGFLCHNMVLAVALAAACASSVIVLPDVRVRDNVPQPFHLNLSPRTKIVIYLVLMGLVIATVFRIVPFWLTLMTVFVALLLLDVRAIQATDFALLLTQFAADPHALLIGVNVGGAGTLVASLASLITFGQFRRARNEAGGMRAKDRSTARFLRVFMAYNVAFLVTLVLVCLPFMRFIG